MRTEAYKDKDRELSKIRSKLKYKLDPKANSARVTAWRKANWEKHQVSRKKWNELNVDRKRDLTLRRKYGIPLAEYNMMLEAQGGTCKICKQPETQRHKRTGKLFDLAVDHDKLTNKIRGLLCSRHNLGIGFFQHNTTTLEEAISYLKESMQ